jgi:signal transduction histidine kinase
VAVLSLLYALHRYRLARVRELERFRLRIASDLHDDVGANLSSIALLSEMLQDRVPADTAERRQLERINRAAGETSGALREIIWIVDPEHDNVAGLIHRMRATAADLLDGTPVRFIAPEPMPRRPLDPFFTRHVFLIYKEALHNVVKHGGAAHVQVEAAIEGHTFRLRVEDDGRGFRECDVRLGHGLESRRRRAHDAGGHLVIDSAPGRGTCVTFRARMA